MARRNNAPVPLVSSFGWKPIPGYPFYEVSCGGFIRRRADAPASKVFGQPMAFGLDQDGYKWVPLSINGRRYMMRVHKAVALAFIGPKPDGKEINHKDGNKLNNKYSNLEYVTQEENIKHQNAHSLRAFGSKNKSTKLTAEKVREMRRMASEGVFQNQIAKQFNVSTSVTCSVVNYATWRHV